MFLVGIVIVVTLNQFANSRTLMQIYYTRRTICMTDSTYIVCNDINVLITEK